MSTDFHDTHHKQLFSPLVWNRQTWRLPEPAAVLHILQSGHKKRQW